jgi:hypothetical protein
MKITQNGQSENSFITKMAIDILAQQDKVFNEEDFSPRKTETHYIQIKKIGLLENLPSDVPEWVTEESWVNPNTAQKLQQF